MNDLQESALRLAMDGFSVFPLEPLGKQPATLHGFKDATTDLETVSQWWDKLPTANVGVATGQRSQIWVLDADEDAGKNKHGLQDLQTLIEKYGPLPPTRAAITPRLGMHFYFSYEAERPINNSVSKLARGLDSRGDGGYVAAPASERADGAYLWVSDDPIAVAPAWLTEMLCKPKTNSATPPKRVPLTGTNVDLALQCLQRLSPSRADNYQQWVEVGMSLFGLGYAGLQLWDDWSRKSGKYQTGACEQKWKSFALMGLGLGSLVHWAEEDSPRPIRKTARKPWDYADIIAHG